MVRITVGYFYLDLNTDIVNQDILLMFGLDQTKSIFVARMSIEILLRIIHLELLYLLSTDQVIFASNGQ